MGNKPRSLADAGGGGGGGNRRSGYLFVDDDLFLFLFDSGNDSVPPHRQPKLPGYASDDNGL